MKRGWVRERVIEGNIERGRDMKEEKRMSEGKRWKRKKGWEREKEREEEMEKREWLSQKLKENSDRRKKRDG